MTRLPALLVLAACGGGETEVPLDVKPIGLKPVTSPTIPSDMPLPPRHHCEGEDISPELVFPDRTPQAQSLAIVLKELESFEDPSERLQWIMWDVSPARLSIPEDIGHDFRPAKVPEAKQGLAAVASFAATSARAPTAIDSSATS